MENRTSEAMSTFMCLTHILTQLLCINLISRQLSDSVLNNREILPSDRIGIEKTIEVE